MDAIFDDFAAAYGSYDGYLLSGTISPEPPAKDPARFYNFLRSSNPHALQTDLRYKLQYNPHLSLDKKEAAAWIEVFTVLYKFAALKLPQPGPVILPGHRAIASPRIGTPVQECVRKGAPANR